mgnify:CR=1 FL=1
MGISMLFRRKKDLDNEVKKEIELTPVEVQEAQADEPVITEEEIPEEVGELEFEEDIFETAEAEQS